MREEFLFGTIIKGRDRLIEQVGKCPADKRGVVPVGFNNNIHWHLGHIATVTDSLVFGLSGEAMTLPAEYKVFFNNGTRPSEWTGEPPSWDDVLTRIKDQAARIQSVFAGKLDAKAKENFFKGETVEELILFNLFHESNHVGNIGAMLKVVGM